MTRLATIAMLSTLTACAGYYGPSDDPAITNASGTLEIINCTGGNIRRSVEHFRQLEQAGTQVMMTGTISSACVLLLRNKSICYAPGARFALHGVTTRGVYDERMSRAFEDALPPKLGAWSRSVGAMRDPAVFTIISGADLAALDDQPRVCGT